MRLLTEYLSTKVKVNNSFPKKPTLENIVNWLKTNGFEQYDIAGKYNDKDEMSNDAISYRKFFINLENARFYVARLTQEGTLKQQYAIVIGNGKPNENNPALTIFASNDGIENIANRIGYVGDYISSYEDIKTVSELKELAYKYFNI